MGDFTPLLLTLVGLTAVGVPLRHYLRRLHVPPAVSLMALGALAGPAVLDVLPQAWADHSSVLSKVAFVVLLLRAGLGLAPQTLRAIVVPAIAFGVIPVAAELLAVFGGSRLLLFEDDRLAWLAGFLVAAVSPAVILPTMLDQKEKGRGGPRGVPDRIMGQTVVNALAAQTGILLMLDVVAPTGEHPSVALELALFPATLLGGLAIGVIAGFALRLEVVLGPAEPLGSGHEGARASVAAALMMAAGLLVYFGCGRLGLESVFATLAIGAVIRRRLPGFEARLRTRLRQVWGLAEIVLFANLGAMIDLGRLRDPGLVLTLLLVFFAALFVRMVVTRLLTVATALTRGERVYVTLAQIPKATIQAVFGPVVYQRLAAAEGSIEHAQTFLIMAVLAIVATAPFGAVVLDRWGGRLLVQDDDPDGQRSMTDDDP